MTEDQNRGNITLIVSTNRVSDLQHIYWKVSNKADNNFILSSLSFIFFSPKLETLAGQSPVSEDGSFPLLAIYLRW